jgi:hypothetical protein
MNLPIARAFAKIALGARVRACANARNGRSIATSPSKTE